MTPDKAYQVMSTKYASPERKYVRIRFYDGDYFLHNGSRFHTKKGAKQSFTRVLAYNIPGYYTNHKDRDKYYEQAKELVEEMIQQELITFEEVEEYE